jgi:chromosome partitioning protein
MTLEAAAQAMRACVVVVGNEKGGSGKSTVAMHVAVALMKSGQTVASLDLDSRQKTFTHYIENRHAWAQQAGLNLEIPDHHYFVEKMDHRTAEDDTADENALVDQMVVLARDHDFIVIDTPGRDSHLGRLAHSMADTLITPMNDSFVDLDVIATVDREALSVTGASHYAQMVEEARRQHLLRGNVATDWIVLRNRLSMLGSRNTRCVGQCLEDLSRMLDFRCVEGLAERVIFREFYSRGLTALDSLDAATLGTRPTLSHVTARLEIDALIKAMRLERSTPDGNMAEDNRDAA